MHSPATRGFDMIKAVSPSIHMDDYLTVAEQVITPSLDGHTPPPVQQPIGKLKVGVDLGTAYLVTVALNESNHPIAGEFQFAQVVRDGLVVDFEGATDLLLVMKARLEKRLGTELTHAASGYPPQVPQVEVRATAHVLEAAGMECTAMVEEPIAANNVLGINNGAIVDVGGGTTGIAVVKNGKIIHTADEPTGGTHFSLVIAGALDITFDQAEELKKKASEQNRLFLVIHPVMEKVASIIKNHIKGYQVKHLYMVGGTCAFPGMAEVVSEKLELPVTIPTRPLFVTPLGIAMQDKS